MELRHLRYFVAVADHGGIRLAAEYLNVAQPAITRQIKDLERELGVPLLRREGRGVVLTDAGRAYAGAVRQILDDVEEAGVAARKVAEGRGGRLAIGLLENASWAGIAPAALKRFARAHPDIALDIRPMASVQQFAAVAAGTLDGGFAYRLDPADRPGVTSFLLRHDDVMLAATHDLVFDHDGDLDPADIDGLAMIGFHREAAPIYHDRLEAAMAGIGLTPNLVQVVGDETTMLSLVSAGVGCALVNSANRHRPPPNVQFRSVNGLSVPIPFHFFHRDPPGSLMDRFLAVLAQSASD
ncbi:MAG: LysR family transcriptional regulator [Pseudomonadota bacterium]